ncbi:MAG: hypothetical protein ACOZJZ_01540 [Pseudomonadota bacterium]
MIEPKVHLAFAPRGAGLLYGVLWFADGKDVYGWYIGSRDGVPEASFFMLPAFYTGRPVALYRTVLDDVYGPWVETTDAPRETALPHTPVPEPLCHELGRLQDEFVRHWLFFDDDPDAAAQAAIYAARELPVRHANIRAERLQKLHTAPAVWHYDTPGADRKVLLALSQRWPLDEQLIE